MITAMQKTEWAPLNEIQGAVGAEFEITAFGETRTIICRRGRDNDEADTNAFGFRIGRTGQKIWYTNARFYRQPAGDWRMGAGHAINKQGVAVCWYDKAPQQLRSKR